MKKIGKNLVVLLWWMVGLIKRHRALINFLVNSPNCFSRVYGCLKSTQILVKKCVNLLIKCAACWLRECGPNCFSGVWMSQSTQILVKKMCELIDKVCNVLVKKMWCKLRQTMLAIVCLEIFLIKFTCVFSVYVFIKY